MHVFFSGISGIGISALAKIYLQKGAIVYGSDLQASDVADQLSKAGARIIIGEQKADNVPTRLDLFVYSNALPADHPELAVAIKSGVKCQTYPEALGDVFNKTVGVAVAGTHGKSTTSSMLSQILIEAKMDPTVVIGTKTAVLGNSNARVGQGAHMIIEADEYKGAFYNYNPQAAVILNVEWDHPDVYKTADSNVDAFKRFAGQVSDTLALNGDWQITYKGKKMSMSEALPTKAKVITFGTSAGCDVRVSTISEKKQGARFTLRLPKQKERPVQLRVPGTYNAMNAAAAATVAWSLGVEPSVIARALENFKGSWRRFELRGQYEGVDIIDDYAHHPTAVREAGKAFRTRYPKGKLLVIAQLHHAARIRNLYDNFVTTLVGLPVDEIWLTDFYVVAGREQAADMQAISAPDMATQVDAKTKAMVGYTGTVAHTQETLRAAINDFDAVLLIGAGDILSISDALMKK